jgi:hypothetical protein
MLIWLRIGRAADLLETKGTAMIDTSELDKTARPEAVELRDALVEYKQTSGRMFPTCSEVLEVVRDLGYERLSPETDEEETVENAEFHTEPVEEEPLEEPAAV